MDYFNPLPPCGGRHLKRCQKAMAGTDFNPLPPCGGRQAHGQHEARRETKEETHKTAITGISIHSLRVEGDEARRAFLRWQTISIHSLRVEGDGDAMTPQQIQKFQSTPSVWRETVVAASNNSVTLFQSTPSVWRETGSSLDGNVRCAISIHSLRVEGDMPAGMMTGNASYFNPLPPCGGRRI